MHSTLLLLHISLHHQDEFRLDPKPIPLAAVSNLSHSNNIFLFTLFNIIKNMKGYLEPEFCVAGRLVQPEVNWSDTPPKCLHGYLIMPSNYQAKLLKGADQPRTKDLYSAFPNSLLSNMTDSCGREP